MQDVQKNTPPSNRRCTQYLRMSSVALASASLPLLAAAQSNVTLYGAVDAAMVYSSNQAGKSNIYMNSGNLNASKFGFRGVEDLGNGLQAIFTLEQGFNIDTGAQSDSTKMFNRQSFLGLSNARYGSLTAGRQYTPYYLYVGGIGSADAVTGAIGAHPGDLDGLDTTIRVNNSVSYASPVMAGVQASAFYGFGENAGDTKAGNTMSAALRYSHNAIAAAVGVVRLNNGDAMGKPWDQNATDPFTTSGSFAQSAINSGYVTAKTVQMIAAAGRYVLPGGLMLGLNFSNVQMTPGMNSLFAQKASFNTAGFVTSYQPGPAITLAAGYTYTRALAANGISDPARYQQISLKQIYDFSKFTSLYFLQAYQKSRGQTLDQDGVTPINAMPVVGDLSSNPASSSGKQFAAVIGLRHHF
jgi:predicted porin